MVTDSPELNQILKDLKAGKTPPPTTIRTFMGWFEIRRRSYWNVRYIDEQLAKANLRTVPSYLDIWVDTPVTFELIPSKEKTPENHLTKSGSASETSLPNSKQENEHSFSIGNIKSANIPPVSIAPNDKLSKAKTIMVTNNFSQLPVMISERTVKGVISWRSIGIKSMGKPDGDEAKDYMENHKEVTVDTSIFDAIPIISETGYVLIRAKNNSISGIITSADIADEFRLKSASFLLIQEIEISVRSIISRRLSVEQIVKTCLPQYLPSAFTNINQLTFGNYVKILENPENWEAIGLSLDRSVFCSKLDEVNQIRNSVMHFDPDGDEEEYLVKLRSISSVFRNLRDFGLLDIAVSE
jgi:predicted transcriptional regulator